MSKPVVLQVLHAMNVGGAEVLVARLVRRLRERFTFVFACLDELGTLGEELRGEGFTVEVLGRRPGVDWRCARKLGAFAQQCGARVIQAHQYTPFFYSRAPGWFGRRPPVLFTEHGRAFPDYPSRKRMVFNHWFLRKCDHVVAVGEAVKKALIDNEGLPAQRIEVIYNGVRLDDFNTGDKLRREIRAALDIATDVPVAIQVARLDYLKDHATALRAAKLIREQLPNFQLLLVGEGPERPKIEQLIAELNLSANVRMLGRRSDIRELLAAADLFLLTSISEGIPVTLIEAMSARLPVVSTAAGGVGEVVEHETTGLLCPIADDQALAQATVRLLNDPDARRRFGEQGYHRAHAAFSEAHMHEQYARLFERLAS